MLLLYKFSSVSTDIFVQMMLLPFSGIFLPAVQFFSF
ncbi:hypothetical protein SLEP1_g26511 [Rubroshorea leprosula]|uniref:Uncharacterized protein n=1 Tax=Rubroshorea leprosula TaxID=152421 RepID=A0AAV5JMB0_9ROSI|nr:hypothetical protein SLEP1_g26511 [Rubroshorea leprosula]